MRLNVSDVPKKAKWFLHHLSAGRGWGGVESPTKFSKKVVFPNFLTGSEFLEGGCWKRGVTFFSRVEGLQFLHKK